MLDGVTPVFVAAQNGHQKALMALLEHHASPHIPLISSETSLRRFAARTNNSAVISRMEDFLSSLDPSIDREKIPMTAKEIAIVMGHDDIVRYLATYSPPPAVTAQTSTIDANQTAQDVGQQDPEQPDGDCLFKF